MTRIEKLKKSIQETTTALNEMVRGMVGYYMMVENRHNYIDAWISQYKTEDK